MFDLETAEEALVKDGINFDKKQFDKNLTLFLYPDDSDEEGKILRVYQQYFMVSSAAQLILAECEENGVNLSELHKSVVVQINDTHPVMIIPELIRLLTDKVIPMEKEIKTVSLTCAYTNHTILAEALEKWPYEDLKKAVPKLVPIIDQLDRYVREKYSDERVYIKDRYGKSNHYDKYFLGELA